MVGTTETMAGEGEADLDYTGRAYSEDSLKHEDQMREMIAYGIGQREVVLVDIKFRLVGKNLTGPYCSRPW